MCHRHTAAAVGIVLAVACFLAGPLMASAVAGVTGGLLALVWRAVSPLVPVLRLMNKGVAWGP